MRLKTQLLRLPKSFDAARLAAEAAALPPSAWVPHPGNYPGNDAVLLVTPNGTMTNGFVGPMAPTAHLLACPYIMEVMGEIGAVWGRSRLMGLGAGAVVPAHVDANYHWRTHMRVHIPVITNPDVVFTCGDDQVHMAAGECWVFDSFRMHNVRNGGGAKRIHLVLDTVGGEEMWDLIDSAQNPDHQPQPGSAPRTGAERLRFERVELQPVMSPWEVRSHIAFLAEHMAPNAGVDAAFAALDRFLWEWTALWGQYGGSAEGAGAYRRLMVQLQQQMLTSGAGNLLLRNQLPLSRALSELIFQVAVPGPASAASVPAGGQRLAS